MGTIDLIEGRYTPIPQAGLTDRAARALAADPRFDLAVPAPETGAPYRLRSLGWIGQFPVEDRLIAVAPRHPLAIVFEMLDIAYGLRRFRRPPSAPDVATIDGLFQGTVSILAAHVEDRVRRGLYRHHVQRVEDLCFGPGPTESGGRLARLVRQDPYLRCRYDERIADLQDNQILLWALYAASKARLKDAAVDQTVRHGYRALAGSLDLSNENANHSIGEFYRRLDTHRPVPGLCRLILEHTGPALPSDGKAFIPFAINMPTLFRAFVARWLSTNLPNEFGLRVRYTARLRANGLLDLQSDMAIEDKASGRPLMALDTAYDHDAEPPATVLASPPAPQDISPSPAGAVAARTAVFDLNRPVNDAGKEFLDQLQLAG